MALPRVDVCMRVIHSLDSLLSAARRGFTSRDARKSAMVERSRLIWWRRGPSSGSCALAVSPTTQSFRRASARPIGNRAIITHAVRASLVTPQQNTPIREILTTWLFTSVKNMGVGRRGALGPHLHPWYPGIACSNSWWTRLLTTNRTDILHLFYDRHAKRLTTIILRDEIFWVHKLIKNISKCLRSLRSRFMYIRICVCLYRLCKNISKFMHLCTFNGISFVHRPKISQNLHARLLLFIKFLFL